MSRKVMAASGHLAASARRAGVMRSVSPMRATLMTRIDLTGDALQHRPAPRRAMPCGSWCSRALQARECMAVSDRCAVLAPAQLVGNRLARGRIEHVRQAREARVVAIKRVRKTRLDQAALRRSRVEIVDEYERGVACASSRSARRSPRYPFGPSMMTTSPGRVIAAGRASRPRSAARRCAPGEARARQSSHPANAGRAPG